MLIITVISRSPRKRVTEDPTQMIIDAGQKEFGLTHCETCDTYYNASSLFDKENHIKIHNFGTTDFKFKVSSQ